MRIFSSNPEKFITEHSDIYSDYFLTLLRGRPEGKFYPINSLQNEMARDKTAPRLFATRWPQLSDFLKEMEEKGVLVVQIDPNTGTHVMLAEASKRVGSVKRVRTAEEQAAFEKLQQDQWYKLQEKRVREAEEHAKLVLQRANLAQGQDGYASSNIEEAPGEFSSEAPIEEGFSIDLKSVLHDLGPAGVEPSKSAQAQQAFAMLGKRTAPHPPLPVTLDHPSKGRLSHLTPVQAASKGLVNEGDSRSIHQTLGSQAQPSEKDTGKHPMGSHGALPPSKHKGWVCKHIVVQIHDK